eukprot:COSAG02_NODE_14555_length_1260_cov_1.075797_1_plen_62_part_10
MHATIAETLAVQWERKMKRAHVVPDDSLSAFLGTAVTFVGVRISSTLEWCIGCARSNPGGLG